MNSAPGQRSLFRLADRRQRGTPGTTRQAATNVAKDNLWLLQRLSLLHSLDDHRGCVNTVCWNESGSWLLSGSDDHRLLISDPYSRRVVADVHTAHRANIFSAKFLSCTCDSQIVSCAGDGTLLFTDVERQKCTQRCLFTCHSGTTYEVLAPPGDPYTFLSCGEDGTVRWFDLRTKQKCAEPSCKEDVLIQCASPITSISLNPMRPFHVAAGSSDSTVRIFDRRMLGTKATGQDKARQQCMDGLLSRFSVPELEGKSRRITSVDYRPDGQEVLASYSSDYIYIFDALADDASRSKKLYVGRAQPSSGHDSPRSRGARGGPRSAKSPPSMKRLRLRGDWSDTGPNARPERETGPETPEQSQDAEEQPRSQPDSDEQEALVHGNLMQRMTDALSRMLNDPSTRMAMRTLQNNRERIQEQIEEARITNEPSDQPAQPRRRLSSEGPDGEAAETSENDAISSSSQMQRVNSSEEPSTEPEPIGAAAGPISTIRHQSEPEVNLRYGNQGPDSSTISINRWQPVAESSPDDSSELPGPSQVVTHPGNSGQDPVTGQRQRRRGVSGPSTGSSEEYSPPARVLAWTHDPGDEDVEDEEDDPNTIYEFEEEEGEEEQASGLTANARLISQPPVFNKLVGHRNARTMIKEATWWGNNYILSGSDCGHIFGWERATGKLVLLQEADRHVVNCVQPHPVDPILASSGIDYDVKIWAPLKECADFDEAKAAQLVRRNEVMLEETRDTITVPATLMIRMLASLNQIRRAGRMIPRVLAARQRERRDGEDDPDAPAGAAASGLRREEFEDGDLEDDTTDEDLIEVVGHADSSDEEMSSEEL